MISQIYNIQGKTSIFFHIAFPNFSFVPINKKQTNKQGTLYSLVWKVTILNTHRPGWFAFVAMISHIYNIQAKTSRIPCLKFGESRFQGSLNILFPVKIFSVSRIPHCILVKSRIPKNNFKLQDLVEFSPQQIKHRMALRVGTGVLSKSRLQNNPCFCLG